MELPYGHEGRYGRLVLDHAACGDGFVVQFTASPQASAEGHSSRWETFQNYHTALAYFWALSGRHTSRQTGRGVKGSRRPAKAGRGQPLMPLEVF